MVHRINKRMKAAREVFANWNAQAFQQLLQQQPELNTLYRILVVEPENSIAVTSASIHDIRDVLEFDISSALSMRTDATNWYLDPTVPSVEPSPTFLEQSRRLEDWLSPNSESLSRSWLDVCLTEAMSLGENIGALSVYGSVSLSKTNQKTGRCLSGEGDYCVGIGELNRPERIENLVLVGEAKSCVSSLDFKAQKQILAYMAIVHLARRDAGKKNPGVFGFLSNKSLWIFFRIDNEGKIWRSMTYDAVNISIVLQWLRFIVQSARVCSAPTTPYDSQADLALSPLFASWDNLTAFEPLHKDVQEDSRAISDTYTMDILDRQINDDDE